MAEPVSSDAFWPPVLPGKRILIVEDEYLLAQDLQESVEAKGGEVLGPVASVASALALLESGPAPDLAILDVNLRGEKVFPVAEALRARGIPFVFATGYGAQDIPEAYADVPRAEKPLTL